MVVWSVGPSSLRGSAKLRKHALGGGRLQKCPRGEEDIVASVVQREGSAWCSVLHEKDEPHRPQKGDKEREESKWMESVRDYTVLLPHHSPSIGTSRATRIWASCSPLTRSHHGKLEVHRSGLAVSLSLQAERTCF